MLVTMSDLFEPHASEYANCDIFTHERKNVLGL